MLRKRQDSWEEKDAYRGWLGKWLFSNLYSTDTGFQYLQVLLYHEC